MIDGEVGGLMSGALVTRVPVATLAPPGAEHVGAEPLPGYRAVEGVVPAAVGLAGVLGAAATRAAGDDTTGRAQLHGRIGAVSDLTLVGLDCTPVDIAMSLTGECGEVYSPRVLSIAGLSWGLGIASRPFLWYTASAGRVTALAGGGPWWASRRRPMKRLIVAGALAAALALGSVGSALGAIHPIMSAECAAAVASAIANDQDPPGQVPPDELAFFFGLVPVSGSELRALIATGVILVDANGFFAGIDFTVPALNGNNGTFHCPNA